MLKNTPQNQEPCYLCGGKDRITREHVPAKGLFPKPRPSNLQTVPCCYDCNNKYSKDDEYFRIAASCLMNVNQTGKLIWTEKVLTSTLQARRIGTLVDEVADSVKPATVKTRFGDIPATTIEFDALRINSVLIRLTKGFLYKTHPDLDRGKLSFEVTNIDQFKLHSIVDSGVDANFTQFAIGDVYRHWRALAIQDNYYGIWVHMFYGASVWMLRHHHISRPAP